MVDRFLAVLADRMVHGTLWDPDQKRGHTLAAMWTVLRVYNATGLRGPDARAVAHRLRHFLHLPNPTDGLDPEEEQTHNRVWLLRLAEEARAYDPTLEVDTGGYPALRKLAKEEAVKDDAVLLALIRHVNAMKLDGDPDLVNDIQSLLKARMSRKHNKQTHDANLYLRAATRNVNPALDVDAGALADKLFAAENMGPGDFEAVWTRVALLRALLEIQLPQTMRTTLERALRDHVEEGFRADALWCTDWEFYGSTVPPLIVHALTEPSLYDVHTMRSAAGS